MGAWGPIGIVADVFGRFAAREVRFRHAFVGNPAGGWVRLADQFERPLLCLNPRRLSVEELLHVQTMLAINHGLSKRRLPAALLSGN